MRIYVDLDSSKLILSPGFATEVTQLGFKRSPTAAVEVQFTRNGVVIELPLDATGIFGVKKTGKYDDSYVTAALAWLKSGTGTDTVYTFTISLINTALDALFFVDGNITNDVAQLSLMGELQWSTGGNTVKTPTLTVLIDNDVNRVGDTAPSLPQIAYAVFLPSITDLVGGASNDLDSIDTTPLQLGYIVEVLVPVAGTTTWLTYYLKSGPTTGGTPGQVAPVSYNVSTNNKHWEGAYGPQGPAGAVWRTGLGMPASTLGVDGDWYLLFSPDFPIEGNGNIYTKRSGAYCLVGNIVGPVGPQGPSSPPVDIEFY